MRWWLLVLSFLVVSVSVMGQPPIDLPGLYPDKPVPLLPFTTYYEVPLTHQPRLADVAAQAFRPYSNQAIRRPMTRYHTVLWLRFTVRNQRADTLRRWLYVGRHYLCRLYSSDSAGRYTLQETIGLSIPINTVNSRSDSKRSALLITLLPRQKRSYLLMTTTVQSFDPLSPVLYTPTAYTAFQLDNERRLLPVLLFYVGLIACLLFISTFAIGQYLTNRDLIYVWYALYLLCTCLHFFRVTEAFFQLDWWLPNQPVTRDVMVPFFVLGIMVCYPLFFGTLLELPRYQPRLWRWFRAVVGVLVLLFVLELGICVVQGPVFILRFHYSPAITVFHTTCMLIDVLLAALALRGPHPLRSYAFAGFLLLIAGGLAAFVLNRIDVSRESIFTQTPSLFLGIATLLELLCFSLALGKRSYLVEAEKNQMQSQYAQDLEAQLQKRMNELVAQNRQLETQRIEQLQLAFDHKLAETEMAAIRAQMNPHFIFNCLNSIKAFTLDNDIDRASDYLTKFARLIRLVLENSRAERITLQNEFDTLQLYIEMEAMRFKQKLRYQISLAPDIDTTFIEIPPLLIQPYVENAIWHGLMHKAEGGEVVVDITQPHDDLLLVVIRDDGIGRARATELKSKSVNKNRSFGTQLTADRIALINQLYQTRTAVTIRDMTDASGRVAGTEVTLEIPV